MSKQTSNKFSPEVRSRAVPGVLDHEHEHPSRWATIVSVSAKIGCTAQTLLEWVKKAEVIVLNERERRISRRGGWPMARSRSRTWPPSLASRASVCARSR